MQKTRTTKALFSILVTTLCALFSIALDKMGIRVENVMMVYIVGVLVVIVETTKLSYGLMASVLSIVFFNFFLTEPRYTLIVDDPNYLITFFIFLVVTIIASSLTNRLQQQANLAKANAENTQILYEITSGSFLFTDREQLIQYSIDKLTSILRRPVFAIINEQFALQRVYTVKYNIDDVLLKDKDAIDWSIHALSTTGNGSRNFGTIENRYIPIKSRNTAFGVIGIDCKNSPLSINENIILETIASQIGLAIEQDILYKKNEQAKLEIEKEKIRNNLLRSISHDLRTPLTSISGSADFIVDSFDKLERETIKTLLKDISDESLWLHGMVENLLHMTRIQDGKLLVNTSIEIIDDILEEAVTKTKRFFTKQTLSIHLPKEVIMVAVDSTLIIQVLVNIIGNALKYAGESTKISIKVALVSDGVQFVISDDGPGFPENVISSINNDRDNKYLTTTRGMGMGLCICHAIIQAHQGSFNVHNKADGGAEIIFILPLLKIGKEGD